jgi:hypothetical protein
VPDLETEEKLVLKSCKHLCLFIILVFITLSAAEAQTAERLIVLEGTTASAHVIDPNSNSELATINVGATPASVVIAQNGRLAFVANLNSQFVSVIDLTINAEIKRIRNVRAFYMALTAEGRQIVATDPVNEQIYVIDTNALVLSNTISLNGLLGDDPNSDDLGFNNLTIAANKVYINSSNAVGVVNLATSAVSTVNTTLGARTFTGSESIATTSDGQYVLAIRAGGTVIINSADDSVVQTPSFAGFSMAASGPASAANRSYVYLISNSAGTPTFNIADLNTGSPTFGQIIAAAPLPSSLPLNNGTRLSSSLDGTRAYITVQTRNNPNLLVIDTNAVISNPAAAVIAQLQVGVQARGSVSGLLQTQVDASAPVVTGVSQPLVANNGPNTITVSGSGFAPGAQVRVGNLDPVNAQFLSSSSLQVAIPQNAPAQGAAIIVTNPNLESGILRGAFVIASAPAFQPANQVGVTNFADSTFSVLNVSTNATVSPATSTAATPLGVAITPDGARAYIEGFFSPASIDVYNFTTGLVEAHIVLNGDLRSTPGQTAGIVLAPRLGTQQLAAYVVSGRQLSPAPTFSEELYIIDADPTSATFNTVIKTIPTGGPNPSSAHGALAVTPDGRYAFINEFLNGPQLSGNLIVLDLSSGASTVLPASTLGMSDFQPNMELSPDGKMLALTDNAGAILVMDVSTNPANPTLVARLQGTAPAGLQPLSLGGQRIIGKRLFAFDAVQNVVDVFNFDSAVPNFSELGAFAFSGTGTQFGVVPDVTADGSLIYLPLREEDSVAVVDVNKALANDPAALLTKIGVGIAPTSLRVRPGTPTLAGLSVPVQPIPQVSLTFDSVTASGATSVSTTFTNPDPLPAGFFLGTPPLYYEISSTAAFAGNVQVCITYNPAQFSGLETNIRLLHDDGGSFVDVTTSLDTSRHVVCGSVTHFSAFTVGLGSTDFLFTSLLKEIKAGVQDRGNANSLTAKVQAAQAAFDRGLNESAQHVMRAFENEVRAQSGKKLSASETSRLLGMADAILGQL